MRRMGVLFAVALSGSLVLSGCSFALVSGPPATHRELPMFDCTRSRVGPILDTVWTTLQVLRIAGAASTSDAEWQQRSEARDGDAGSGAEDGACARRWQCCAQGRAYAGSARSVAYAGSARAVTRARRAR